MKKILFDAHAILKWLKAEPGTEKVVAYLEQAQSGKITSLICQINVGEVYYKVIRAKGLEEAKRFLATFKLLPIRITPITEDLVLQASEIKAKYPLSYADCFTCATAIKEEATILTGDPDFKKVEEIVKIEWL